LLLSSLLTFEVEIVEPLAQCCRFNQAARQLHAKERLMFAAHCNGHISANKGTLVMAEGSANVSRFCEEDTHFLPASLSLDQLAAQSSPAFKNHFEWILALDGVYESITNFKVIAFRRIGAE
jgi:hypothetical protein